MIEMTRLESKIIRQVEYYFSDLNVTRDKFMKEAISQNDGWISWETLLKFNRLKTLSDDATVIENTLKKSTSSLIEVGSAGIRRNPDLELPDTFDEAYGAYKDSTVYVKGFDPETTLDEIIQWLETHGGKTLHVHMRRILKDRKFKGSIFAVFEKKEDADKFLKSEDSVKFGENDIIRMFKEDYWKSKEDEKNAKVDARVQKAASEEAIRNEQVTSRMVSGSLLELKGLPEVDKCRSTSTNEDHNGETKTSNAVKKSENELSKKIDEVAQSTKEETTSETESAKVEEVPPENSTIKEEQSESQEPPSDGHVTPSVMALKQLIVDKVDVAIAWVDVFPASGTAIVRFKTPNSAEQALEKLKASYPDGRVMYAGCELTGRVLTGTEELNHWKKVLEAQKSKLRKRQHRGDRGFQSKRRRRF